MAGPRPPLKHSWLASERRVPRLIARPLRSFLHMEAAGGVVLLGAAVVALAWANSPFANSYETFWHTEVGLRIGTFELREDLAHWVNDALMVLFFFVVGLEIKRELVVGELNDPRAALLPAIAAVGGMVGPVLLYFALTSGGEAVNGWGIPMATDIAFAVGVLALLGDRVPSGLKVFVLSLAIVDDIGAILVIALFYSSGIELAWLFLALALVGMIVVLRRLGVYWVPLYVGIGFFVWLATFESGVHATIAGVALGFLAPARPSDPQGFPDVVRQAHHLPDEPDAEALHALTVQGNEVVSVAERLLHRLHPWSSFVVIPVFALANAGVRLDGGGVADAARSPVALGVAAGLVVGKIAGISAATWLAVRLGVARLPQRVTWRHLLGGSAVAGIGFTVSLFIANLAFEDGRLIDQAKVGILGGSLVAAGVGTALLLCGVRPQRGGERSSRGSPHSPS